MVVVFEGRWVGWFYSNSCFYYLLLLFFFCFVVQLEHRSGPYSFSFLFSFFFFFGMEEFFFYLSEIG